MSQPISKLREVLQKNNLKGYVIPLTDAYQNEYVPKYAECLPYMTGFTGSSGLAIVTMDGAAFFTDGRYTLQAQKQVDSALFDLCDLTVEEMSAWIKNHIGAGESLGYFPWVHTSADYKWLEKAAAHNGGNLVATENLVEEIWDDQPARPKEPVRIQPIEYSGKSSKDKRQEIAERMKADHIDAAIITKTDSSAWLLNMRGADIACNPIVLCYIILHADSSADLYIDKDKLSEEVLNHFGEGVRVHGEDEFEKGLQSLQGKVVQVDEAATPYGVLLALEGSTLKFQMDVCAHPKACKNEVEIEGAKQAHIRDGKVLCEYLYWVDTTTREKEITEIEAADHLYQLRSRDPLLRELSFPTISGAGAHGAIIHYMVTPETDAPLKQSELYLVDSGGQYQDGTTDVTRVLAIGGTPTQEQKDRFTLVLKGHIAIATSRFPTGTTGSQLDTLARHALWQQGLDYAHGTGHGVGSYLNVHEGPQRIAKGASPVPLEPGMIVSNEPGYYKPGEYGIRIENLEVVVPCHCLENPEQDMLMFESLTLAPISKTLINKALLTEKEIAWVDQYHKRVYDTIHPLLERECALWLEKETKPL